AWLANRIRRRSDCVDGSTGDAGGVDSAAVPMDVRHAAIFLEASRYVVPAKVRHARLDCSAKHFCFPTGAAIDLTDYLSDVPWLNCGLGADAAETIVAAAAELGYSRLGAIGAVFSGLFDY